MKKTISIILFVLIILIMNTVSIADMSGPIYEDDLAIIKVTNRDGAKFYPFKYIYYGVTYSDFTEERNYYEFQYAPKNIEPILEEPEIIKNGKTLTVKIEATNLAYLQSPGYEKEFYTNKDLITQEINSDYYIVRKTGSDTLYVVSTEDVEIIWPSDNGIKVIIGIVIILIIIIAVVLIILIKKKKKESR